MAGDRSTSFQTSPAEPTTGGRAQTTAFEELALPS
jgi:hypothetical protein